MTKQEMAAKLAQKCDLSVSKASEVVSAIFDASPGQGIVAGELSAGRKVSIPGFGTFGTRYRGPRQGRNPATGAPLMISGRNVVYFKAGKTLKEGV